MESNVDGHSSNIEHLNSHLFFISGIRVVHFVKLHVFTFFGSVLLCTQFPCNNHVQFIFTPIYFVGIHVLLMLFVFINIYWCPTRFPCQMMFMSFNSNMTGVTYGAGTANPSGAPEFTPSLKWGPCCSIFRFLCSVL